MKLLFLTLLAAILAANAAEDHHLRRGLAKGGNGKPEDPPQNGNRPEKVLAKVAIDDEGGTLELFDGDDTIYISVVASKEETLERVNGLGPKMSGNPVALYQHFAPPGNPTPPELRNAKRRIDQSIREEEENGPVEYAEAPEGKGGDIKEDDQDVRRLEALSVLQEADVGHPRERRLLCAAPPTYTVGSNEWWYQNYCHPDTLINQNECTCYTSITGDMWHWVYDDRIDFWAYAYRGGVWMFSYNWDCDGGCSWKKTVYQQYVRQGYVGHVWTYGPNRYRKGEVDYADGDGYHWSFYSTSGSCTYCRDTNIAPPWCEYCQKKNFNPNL